VRLAGAHAVGAALTRELTRRGARVSMVARSAGPLADLAAETGAAAVPLDLAADASMVDAMEELEVEHGPVDLLVNNAALGDVAPFLTLPVDASRRHLHANLVAPMEFARAVLPGMIARRRGTVVNVCSVAGEMASRNAAPYAASKAGLSLFSSNLQRELKREPVNVLLLVLGEVDTAMLDQVRADPTMNALAKRVGKLKALTPDEVATKLCDAVERDRKILVLPPAARPILAIRHVPSRLMDLAMIGVK
jgi:short-subunit dehydrogenase